jgi:hypothetical protein
MSDAPERIWADGNAEWDSGSWGRSKEFDNDVEYVRADRIEELEAKLAKAVEALDRIQDGSYGKLAAKARTILAELKGEERG